MLDYNNGWLFNCKRKPYAMRMVQKRFYHCHKNASLRARINIGQPTKIINTRRCYLMSSDTNSLAHTKWNCKYHIVFAPKYRRQVIYGKIKRYRDYIASIM